MHNLTSGLRKATGCRLPLDLAQRRERDFAQGFSVFRPGGARPSGETTWAGFVYVAFVMDVFARRIIGWCVARSMHAEPVLDALQQALRSRSAIAGVVHHSDRGSQYLSIR